MEINTFLPYPDFALSAKVLDNKRLGKQRIEARQILEINDILTNQDDYIVCSKCNQIFHRFEFKNILKTHTHYPDGIVFDLFSYRRVDKKYTGREPLKLAWENHPAVLMWRGYELALAYYGKIICEEWISRGFRDNQLNFFVDYLKNTFGEGFIDPPWMGKTKLHLSHQSNLLRKDWDYYIKYFGENIQDTTIPYYWPVKKEN